MGKYKICYSGYDFVEANSQEEAEVMWKFVTGHAYLNNLSVDVVMEVDGERRTDEK